MKRKLMNCERAFRMKKARYSSNCEGFKPIAAAKAKITDILVLTTPRSNLLIVDQSIPERLANVSCDKLRSWRNLFMFSPTSFIASGFLNCATLQILRMLKFLL